MSEEICIRDEETALLISVHYVQPVNLVHIAAALGQCLEISTVEKEAREQRTSTKGGNVACGLKRGHDDTLIYGPRQRQVSRGNESCHPEIHILMTVGKPPHGTAPGRLQNVM